jgi:hypothetical protein
MKRIDLQRFATGYVEYALDENGETDWTKPFFHKGEIEKVFYEIADAQLSADLKAHQETT